MLNIMQTVCKFVFKKAGLAKHTSKNLVSMKHEQMDSA